MGMEKKAHMVWYSMKLPASQIFQGDLIALIT